MFMNNMYLTKVKKDWYMKDFRILLKSNKDFWKMDNEKLKAILIKINGNTNIQTLYSKHLDTNLNSNNNSYLEFSYTLKVELELFRFVIPHFIDTYNLNSNYGESVCNYNFYFPKENPNFKDNSIKFGINCIDNKNYFKINHIRINLENYNPKMHIEFWNDLKLKLSEL